MLSDWELLFDGEHVLGSEVTGLRRLLVDL